MIRLDECRACIACAGWIQSLENIDDPGERLEVLAELRLHIDTTHNDRENN